MAPEIRGHVSRDALLRLGDQLLRGISLLIRLVALPCMAAGAIGM